jgi:D-threonine aldolase
MQEFEQQPWYVIRSVEKIDSPALVVYADRVRGNIAAALEMVGDAGRLRPHAKTHKTAEVTSLMLNAGITKFKCATIAEAEMLGMAGAPDVLLAYQPIGPKALRFVELTKRYSRTRYSCLVDNSDAARLLNELAGKNNAELFVFIDVNVGMNRTGIAPDEGAVALYEEVAKMNSVKPVGLHAYDGHIHDRDFDLRTQKTNEAFRPVAELKEALSKKGHKDIVIVAGGSPTFPIHAKRPEVVTCNPVLNNRFNRPLFFLAV